MPAPALSAGKPVIGRPIANTQIYILDCHLPSPSVSWRTAHRSGSLPGGYLNRPELTAHRNSPTLSNQGARLYKTGDLARQQRDGNIEYIGRLIIR